jgi:hypothetical protein
VRISWLPLASFCIALPISMNGWNNLKASVLDLVGW